MPAELSDEELQAIEAEILRLRNAESARTRAYAHEEAGIAPSGVGAARRE